MKITKTQLKQLIKEEAEAQILKENIISDIVDKIKDSGEDAWDWIKDNAEDVKDAAVAAGESVADFTDDVVQATLRGVDRATGRAADALGRSPGWGYSADHEIGRGEKGRYTDLGSGTTLSRLGKMRRAAGDEHTRKMKAQTAAGEEASQQRRRDAEDERLAQLDRERREEEEQLRRYETDPYYKKKRQRDAEEGRILQQYGRAGLKRHREREAEERADREYNKREREKRGYQQQSQEWGEVEESISREKLEKIIKEEIAIVLNTRK